MEKVKIYRNVATLKDIDMFYLDTKTKGPVIICLHGRWGRAETWYEFMNQYGGEYRIIAPDQRGHGLSSKPESEYTTEEMSEDIIGLINYLKLEQVIIVGHSMGGGIAGFLASKYPEYIRGAAILDRTAAGHSDKTLLPDKIHLMDPLTKDWPLPFATLRDAMDFIRQFSASDLEYQYFMNSLKETIEGYQMMFNSRAMALNTLNYRSWYELLPSIKCPVLLIRAKASGAVTDEAFEKMQSLIPHCIAYEMSHPDHNVMLGNKEEFYKYFDIFLRYLKNYAI